MSDEWERHRYQHPIVAPGHHSADAPADACPHESRNNPERGAARTNISALRDWPFFDPLPDDELAAWDR
ncbi:MAG: hypothetical protein CL424_19845 [Acidimicrobiaceae bacterium]|nr:hypothetical protein [Acidimicrobiaceae bacterium]